MLKFALSAKVLESNKFWDRLSQITIVFFLVFGLNYAFNSGHFWGEADSYIIATISMQQHGSLDVREGDIEQLGKEFPENYAKFVRQKFDEKRYIHDIHGNQYPWYMGTYSLSVLPLKIINNIFGMPQTHVYHISNVLYYSLALLIVYLYFNQTRKNVFLLILLLVCSPTFVYISWASAEMFICALIIVSLVFFSNGNRYLAAFSMAIASTLNITICGLGVVIFADYLICVYNERTQLNRNRFWKELLGLMICFIPTLITPLWNLYHYRKITPQFGMADFSILWIKRFAVYILDLNLGFLPYFPILLMLFLIIVVIGIYKKDRMTAMLAWAFFTTVFLYSAMVHINCGMTAIARYNAWSAPFLAVTVVSQYDKHVINSMLKKLSALLIIFSAFTTFILTSIVMYCTHGDYTSFTPIASFFLDKVPALYSPYPFTFISRNTHVDGGYDSNAVTPFIYYTKEGAARKILFPPKCENPMEMFEWSLDGNQNDMAWLKSQCLKLMNHSSGWRYLNINPNRKITMKKDDIINYLAQLKKTEYLVIFSVKDEASSKIDENIAGELAALGLKNDLRERYRHSYIAVIEGGHVVYEDLQNSQIRYEGSFDNAHVQVTSAGFEVGNVSEIIINGRNYSKNRRGFNIVVFDNQKKSVVDSVAFDTFDQLQCYR